MGNPQNLNLTFLDGNNKGRIECTSPGWSGIIHIIPRSHIKQLSSLKKLSDSCICIFIEQRIMGRPVILVEKLDKGKKSISMTETVPDTIKRWTHTIFITDREKCLDKEYLVYLADVLARHAVESGESFVVNETKEPLPDIPTEIMLGINEYAEHAIKIISLIGFTGFETLPKLSVETVDAKEFTMKIHGRKAVGYISNDKFILRKGSQLVEETKGSCLPSCDHYRDLYESFISEDYETTKNLSFPDHRAAAAFISGSSANGDYYWRTQDGIRIGQLDVSVIRRKRKARAYHD